MASGGAPELQAIEDALNTLEQEARSVAAGLTEDQGTWRERPDSWSVSECLDHLATANEVYVRAMKPPAARALEQGSRRRRPALPGFVGGWFVRSLEPPVKPAFRGEAPQLIRPRQSPPLADALRRFLESQNLARTFLRNYADIDLARVRFPNPFVRGVRFSLATGLHVIVAHERRHLWQARRVREALAGANSLRTP